MPCRHKEVEVLLQKLKQQLFLAELWSDIPPSKNALSSNAPFAYDQMPFEHWLQFIFIPKMATIVASQNNLPEELALMPMAEQRFAKGQGLSGVLQVIAEIDKKFSRV